MSTGSAIAFGGIVGLALGIAIGLATGLPLTPELGLALGVFAGWRLHRARR
jgi:hypothetical protein